ncbi:sugar ABC transporter permease [Bacillus sp. IB182487]|uniref:Sugar ABC transporter permease n=2 Tax=Metabacillus arenae TaxID=2771434 RepID=A0A926RZL8_9BACI|nr:sugar ABC transporter permease [Metabacillus arenae]
MDLTTKNNVHVSDYKPKKNVWQVLGNSPVPWLLPLAVVLLFVFLYPILEVVRLSFTDAQLSGGDYSYTLRSYITLFTLPGFFSMLVITFIFVSLSVFFQMSFGFIIALLVDIGTKRKLVGTVVARTTVLMAWAIPGVVIGIIWTLLYNESQAGILNYILGFFGIKSIAFLSDPINALLSVTVANIWRGTAFSMILLYAGLQTFPNDVLEAAKIDGANAWQRLTKVILPILMPIICINLILASVSTFNTFDMVTALTAGGPGRATEVIALNVYNTIFMEDALGRGAATAVVLLAINGVMTIVYFRMLSRSEGGKLG